MDFQAINNQAKKHFDNKEFSEALELLERPDLPRELIPNLAKCYYYTAQAPKALELIYPLEKTDDMWIDIALYSNAIGKHEEALKIYEKLDKKNPKVAFNIAWHYLRNNKFREGFSLIQRGSEVRAWGHEYIHLEKGILNKSKRWSGQFTDHLVLILEGGLGDEFIFLRWANYCKTKCKQLTIVCNSSLLRLLINSGYDVVPDAALQHLQYDHYAPAMSLPDILNLSDPQENVTFPYIKSFAEPYITKQLESVSKGKRKIGIKWFGNPEFEHDQFRTIPSKPLKDLHEFGQLFSLQFEDSDPRIPNCKEIIKDWQDTYSVFSALDCLVTSCTSTAHLAGAMGIKVIVLIPLVPYFVWASDTMPWYPNNVTVIRQTKYNDWSQPIERLYNEISRV